MLSDHAPRFFHWIFRNTDRAKSFPFSETKYNIKTSIIRKWENSIHCVYWRKTCFLNEIFRMYCSYIHKQKIMKMLEENPLDIHKYESKNEIRFESDSLFYTNRKNI